MTIQDNITIDTPVHCLFESQANLTPDAPAIVFLNEIWTYGQLNTHADRLSQRLVDAGVAPGSFVGLCLERSPQAIAAMLGILKAGGSYVPLDPTYPDQRLSFMLSDTAAPFVVTDEANKARLDRFTGQTRLIEMNVSSGMQRVENAGDTSHELPGTDIACVMYTSGSTGKPKGVMVTHRGIVRLVRETAYCRFGKGEIFLHMAPLAFDASTFEIWGPLLNGGQVAVVPPGLPSIDTLGDTIQRHRVTTAWLTAGLFHLVVDEMPEILAPIKQLLAGGDVLSPDHVVRALDVLDVGGVLINGYGPTECTTFACCHRMQKGYRPDGSIPIGTPIANTTVHILDEQQRPVGRGAAGELFLGGAGVAKGYLNQPELTHEKFVLDRFSSSAEARLYRTGDRVRWRSDGTIEFLGRCDEQVKIAGHRIEPGEVEAIVLRQPGVREAAVLGRQLPSGDKQLVAYVVLDSPSESWMPDLKRHLAKHLPTYMLPSRILRLERLPLNNNGKIDRQALPDPDTPRPPTESDGTEESSAQPLMAENETTNHLSAPRDTQIVSIETALRDIWASVLGHDVRTDENFFDLGGTSLQLLDVHARLTRSLAIDLSLTDLFAHPTIRSLAQALAYRGSRSVENGYQPNAATDSCSTATAAKPKSQSACRNSGGPCDIAIVGMAGRWPGARNVGEFWNNVRSGIESISRFPENELEAIDSATHESGYVRARSVLEDADKFDAEFFGILPTDALRMDPQQRVLLECGWEALEDAGYDPDKYAGSIGVFAGCSINSYFLNNLCRTPGFIEEFVGSYPLGDYSTLLGTLNDCLATRISYKLNLRGPSLTLQTACSTSLVAVCQACESLVAGHSDMALAGGVSITFPQHRGYRYQAGGMGSSDGYCRPFEARSCGTVFGSGAGVVLLKRLEDALADGDYIYSVIKGFAVNNDGARKVGFAAPSANGQSDVIAKALAMAEVNVESLVYQEAHGTATPLGDPLEFRALTHAFQSLSKSVGGHCAIGTAKANVGHLEAAAGVTGLINATNILAHREIPPFIDFQRENPEIKLDGSPFYFNRRLAPCPPVEGRLAAGVSSFGVGGTNAHVVVEEAPAIRSQKSQRQQVLVLSARTEEALARKTNDLSQHLRAYPEIDIGSAALTLQTGRRAFNHRLAFACKDAADAIRVLDDPPTHAKRVHEGDATAVVFLFPGQGSQHLGMGLGMCAAEPRFRSDVDTCVEILRPLLGVDLRVVLKSNGSAGFDLQETWLAQPALFTIEYALARQFERWGIRPAAMIGHSLGEYVAACLAGVFSLEDALEIVAIRGKMTQQLAPGAMLSVRLDERSLQPWLTDGVSLAAANSPQLHVLSGDKSAISVLEQGLKDQGIATCRLATSHAFHSTMVDPVVEPFTEVVRKFELSAPARPFVSSITGNWISDLEATDPEYWGRHLRQTVCFSKGIQLLAADPSRLYLEVGPGNALSMLTRQHQTSEKKLVTITTLRGDSDFDEVTGVLEAVGKLWLHGVTPEWAQMHEPGRRRCPLPTYPFARKRFWFDQVQNNSPVSPPCAHADKPAVPEFAANTPIGEVNLIQAPRPRPRVERLHSALIEMFEEQSGLILAGCPLDTSFVEIGFDSLFLTKATKLIKEKFGLLIQFRQLLGSESSLGTLAAYLDGKLPADAFAEEPQTSAVEPAAMAHAEIASVVSLPNSALASNSMSEAQHLPPAGVSVALSPVNEDVDSVQSLLREQLRVMSSLMELQLHTLRGVGTAISPTKPAATNIATSLANDRASVAPAQSSPAQSSQSPAATALKASPASQDTGGSVGRFKPIQRGTSALNEQQTRHVETLIKRYNSRTAGSKQLTQQRRSILADPRAASEFRSQWKEMVYPIVTVRSKGSKLWDIDGNCYIDLVNGFGPILFGHGAVITGDVMHQLQQGFETGPQTTLAGECAELFCELTGNERVTFCNSGSEAVMAALRVARTATGRDRVVVFEGSYHGISDEVLASSSPRDPSHSIPLAPGVPQSKVDNITVLKYGTTKALEYIRNCAEDLAAVMAEPVQSRHPDLQPMEFLRELRTITEKTKTALIFDEVVTGFRVHPGGIQELFGIRADLATYGKVLGGGMPIGVLAGKHEFMDALDGGMWQYGDDSFPEVGVTFFAGTFVRHPLAMAAARAVLRHLKQHGSELQFGLARRNEALVKRLKSLFEQEAAPAEIEHFSSWFFIKISSEHPNLSLLFYHLREKGIHIREGYPCFLTTAHSDADLEAIYQAFADSLAELREGGFLLSEDRTVQEPPSGGTGAHTKNDAASAPLTESQLEILLSSLTSDEASCSFNESVTIRLKGPLDRTALNRAIALVVTRHDALRATFDPEQLTVRVNDRTSVECEFTDLTTESLDAAENALRNTIREEASTPFNLLEGPLVRFRLIRQADDLHVLLMTAHHIICDGWSVNVIVDELGKLYGGNKGALLPAMSFLEYARSQAQDQASEKRSEIERWWVERFREPVAPLQLPTDRMRGVSKTFHGDTVRKSIGLETRRRFKEFGAKHGCTLFATVLTAYKSLIHRLTGQADIVVGIPVAGQSASEGMSLVGHCVSFLPLRTRFRPESTVGQVLREVCETLLGAYDHQEYTLGSLVRALNFSRDPARLPIVEVQFNLEQLGPTMRFEGLDASVDPCPKSFINADLFLNVLDSEQGLILDCDFNRDLFDRKTISRWLGYLDNLLSTMPDCAEQLVSCLRFADEVEADASTAPVLGSPIDVPDGRCLHQLIRDQALRTPKAVATICGNQQMTYEELERSSNRFARYLIQQGVRSGDLIGLSMALSSRRIVAMVAALKVGASYILIPSDSPGANRQQIIESSGLRLVLT